MPNKTNRQDSKTIAQQYRLAAAGFVETTVEEFLGLTPEETALIELRLTLSRTLRERRQAADLTQAELAERIGSSQSRVAKAERGDHSVAIDLLVKALFATGVTRQDLAQAIAA